MSTYNTSAYSSAAKKAPALPASIRRDTAYLGFDAQRTLGQLTPCEPFDALQRSYDLAARNGEIRMQPNDSYAFEVVGCNSDRPVIAVLCPNWKPDMQPWAVTYVGPDTRNVLGTCPKFRINRVNTSGTRGSTATNRSTATKRRSSSDVFAAKPKSSSTQTAKSNTRTSSSAAPLYLVCAICGALATPWLYPFLASAVGDPMASWSSLGQNAMLAFVGIIVGIVMAGLASNGYKRRAQSRGKRIMGMALLTPVVAVPLAMLAVMIAG